MLCYTKAPHLKTTHRPCHTFLYNFSTRYVQLKCVLPLLHRISHTDRLHTDMSGSKALTVEMLGHHTTVFVAETTPLPPNVGSSVGNGVETEQQLLLLEEDERKS